jgi:hypothetical protein
VESLEGIAGEIAAASVALDLQAVRIEAEDLAGSGAQEAEAGDVLAPADALEEEAVRGDLGEPAVDAERRQAVGEKLADMGDRAPGRRPPLGSIIGHFGSLSWMRAL